MNALNTCVALGFSLLAISGCRGSLSDEPPIHPNPNMDAQHRFDAQEGTELFADGRAMRPRVDGTIPYGQAKTDESTEKPKDLKSAVANTIAEHIKKDSSRGEISAAIEKEVKRFAEDRAEEKQSNEVAESRRGQTRESFARQNNQQLSKDLANLLSGQNDSQQVGNLLDFKA